MSAPRPYGTDPFHPLGSISNIKQFLYIYNSVPVISSMWCVQMFVYDNCACALTENSNYDPESFLKSFIPLGTCWCALKHPSCRIIVCSKF